MAAFIFMPPRSLAHSKRHHARPPALSSTTILTVYEHVLGQVFLHREHGDALPGEDGLHLVVQQHPSAVLGVLQVVGLDVLPHLLHHLGARAALHAEEGAHRLGQDVAEAGGAAAGALGAPAAGLSVDVDDGRPCFP